MPRQISGLVERRLLEVVRRRLADAPVTVLAGPRAIGKSTLLNRIAADAHAAVIDLDDLDTRSAVASDPTLFAAGPAPVLIDEFQHVPALLDAVKAELNRSTVPGRFVLAGSTRYETLPRAAQSLSGRATVLTVWPLSQGEVDGRQEAFLAALLDRPAELVARGAGQTSRDEYIERVVAGGYPLALTLGEVPRRRWFADYIRLVSERDVLEISRIRQRAQLPRLLARLATRTGQLANISEAARAVSIEPSTAENYTRLLESVFLVHRLPAWGSTARSNVAAMPKLHMVDSGLAAHLLRLTPERLGRRTPQALAEFGPLLETFVVGELLKQLSWIEDVVTAGHWRTRDGREVDAVFERSDGAIAAVEVKSGSRVDSREAGAMAALADSLGDGWLGGVLLYLGAHSYTLDRARNIHVLPVDALWHPAG